jgi:hypothetical protein
MQVARRINLAAVLALALVGCRAAPTSSGPPACESPRLPTLRYLRTEPFEQEDPLEGMDNPQQYWDVLELRNDTEIPFERVAHTSTDWIWTRNCGRVDVFVPGMGWVDPQQGAYCGTGIGMQTIHPRETMSIRTRSWLRPTRVSVQVRAADLADPFGLSRAIMDDWLDVEPVEYDSSRAAPDAKPPALLWGHEATGGE